MKKTPLSKTGKKHTNEWHRKECLNTGKSVFYLAKNLFLAHSGQVIHSEHDSPLIESEL